MSLSFEHPVMNKRDIIMFQCLRSENTYNLNFIRGNVTKKAQNLEKCLKEVDLGGAEVEMSIEKTLIGETR